MARCTHTGQRGQCTLPSVDGSEYCAKHSKEADRIRGYYLNDPNLQARQGHHRDEQSVRSILDEIVLMRTLVENRLNLATNPAEQISAFAAIQPAVANINKFIDNLMKLELRTSQVLTRETLEQVGFDIVEIIIEELNGVENRDPIIDRIAHRISDVIAQAHNNVNQ